MNEIATIARLVSLKQAPEGLQIIVCLYPVAGSYLSEPLIEYGKEDESRD